MTFGVHNRLDTLEKELASFKKTYEKQENERREETQQNNRDAIERDRQMSEKIDRIIERQVK
jgi:hypothetical protein